MKFYNTNFKEVPTPVKILEKFEFFDAGDQPVEPLIRYYIYDNTRATDKLPKYLQNFKYLLYQTIYVNFIG